MDKYNKHTLKIVERKTIVFWDSLVRIWLSMKEKAWSEAVSSVKQHREQNLVEALINESWWKNKKTNLISKQAHCELYNENHGVNLTWSLIKAFCFWELSAIILSAFGSSTCLAHNTQSSEASPNTDKVHDQSSSYTSMLPSSVTLLSTDLTWYSGCLFCFVRAQTIIMPCMAFWKEFNLTM